MPHIVLVIDNNSAVQAIAALALNETDCQVEPVVDGSHAAAKIRELHPHVVLCSRDVPHLDPYQLCAEAKAASPSVCFVLLSPAEAMNETQSRAQLAGYDELLFKPFKSNRLRETVVKLLDRPVASAGAPPASDASLHTGVSAPLPLVKVQVRDRLRAAALCHILERLGFPTTHDDAAPAEVSFYDVRPAVLPQHPVFILGSPGGEPGNGDPTAWIPSPLSEQSVFSTLQSSFPHIKVPERTKHPLSSDQVARLAAQISSTLFTQLLESPAARRRDWQQVTLLFEKLLREVAAPLG